MKFFFVEIVFQDGGSLLVVLDDSTFVSVWEWSAGKKIAEAKVSRLNINFICIKSSS